MKVLGVAGCIVTLLLFLSVALMAYSRWQMFGDDDPKTTLESTLQVLTIGSLVVTTLVWLVLPYRTNVVRHRGRLNTVRRTVADTLGADHETRP